MATNEVVPGPVAGYVAQNVKRLRDQRGWSLAMLSAELLQVGRPILPSGLNRVELGRRRIDVDDLVGLAAALRVSPITLLLPPTAEGEIQITEKITAEARAAWDWVRARSPLPALVDPEDDEVFARVEFQRHAVPAELRRYPMHGAGLEAWQGDGPNRRVRTVEDVNRERNGG